MRPNEFIDLGHHNNTCSPDTHVFTTCSHNDRRSYDRRPFAWMSTGGASQIAAGLVFRSASGLIGGPSVPQRRASSAIG